MTIQEAIAGIVAGKNLAREQTIDVFTQIMGGEATDAQIGAFLVALRMKGETPDEIIGAAMVMREKATHVAPKANEHLVDTCGTGGDGSNTFNISTATALVAAGAGATVAKHGNRSVSSKCGSADVLEALGVNITAPPEVMKKCLDTIGIAFLFAPSLHKAMKHAIGPRKEIALRTIFNVLGPLTNPAGAQRQLLGVFSQTLTKTLAQALAGMGTARAFVVFGMEGLDEISISGPTQVSEVRNGSIKTYTVTPDQFGMAHYPRSELGGDTSKENADFVLSVLKGQQGARRDVVVLNAAFAIAAAGLCDDPKQGIALAEQSIDSGAALKKLVQLAEMTTKS
ncbi:MAG: anthranilate phosphoribosyltransferase [Chitinispirillaceae bacterium]|nr:anthranilate phosphoribosyltransferase [Chitinispirillaceae bacterium]